jgi:tetraprenyl-beta-curcumene synthase
MQATREIAAAVSALFAYLTTVLPRVRRELKELGPLPEAKARNAEAVAVFATLAPRHRRAAVVRAIVALQVAIDRLDVLEEAGWEACKAGLTDLHETWRREVAQLPAGAATLPLIERTVERCAAGQRHTHAAAGDAEELQRWAEELEAPAGYLWFEVAAGASSSVAAHALIAAAADPRTTAETAAAIDAVYHPPVGALTVLLDDLVDLDADRSAGEHNYTAYYASPEDAAVRLGLIADRAGAAIGQLPRLRRHRAILSGVAAYYLGAAKAETKLGRAIRERLFGSLGPGTRLLVAFTRLRR